MQATPEVARVGWGELANPNAAQWATPCWGALSLTPNLHRYLACFYRGATSGIVGMRYRRAHAPGGTFFFTVNLADRSSRLLVDHVDGLRESVSRVKARHPFEIVAWVVLPDHLHAIWTLPPDDADFPTRWALIKAGFSRSIKPGERIGPSRIAKGERGIWQRRFWEHLIRDEYDLQRHVDYVHFNPVKHGHVERASDWAWSSIHRDIRAGIASADWAAAPRAGIDLRAEREE